MASTKTTAKTTKKTATKKKVTKKTKKTSSSGRTIVKWGSLRFRVDGKVVRSVEGFQASLKEKESDSKCKKKYTEPEEIKFNISTSLETGGNPLKDYNYLKSFINANGKGEKKAMKLKVQETGVQTEIRGYMSYFIPGSSEYSKPKGPTVVTKYKTKLAYWKGGKFKLKSVTLKDVQMDGRGRMHAARIELSFVEVPGNIGKGIKQKDPETGKEVVKYKNFDGSWKQVKKYRSQSLVENTW